MERPRSQTLIALTEGAGVVEWNLAKLKHANGPVYRWFNGKYKCAYSVKMLPRGTITLKRSKNPLRLVYAARSRLPILADRTVLCRCTCNSSDQLVLFGRSVAPFAGEQECAKLQ